jgi:hypothetical protein
MGLYSMQKRINYLCKRVRKTTIHKHRTYVSSVSLGLKYTSSPLVVNVPRLEELVNNPPKNRKYK